MFRPAVSQSADSHMPRVTKLVKLAKPVLSQVEGFVTARFDPPQRFIVTLFNAVKTRKWSPIA